MNERLVNINKRKVNYKHTFYSPLYPRTNFYSRSLKKQENGTLFNSNWIIAVFNQDRKVAEVVSKFQFPHHKSSLQGRTRATCAHDLRYRGKFFSLAPWGIVEDNIRLNWSERFEGVGKSSNRRWVNEACENGERGLDAGWSFATSGSRRDWLSCQRSLRSERRSHIILLCLMTTITREET